MRSYSFCTYFDHRYSPYGLALYRSLVRHLEHFELFVLCYDDATVAILQGLGDSRIHIVPIARLEQEDPALVEANRDRTAVERYFTCGPAWIRYAMRLSGADVMTYLDSDLYFFNHPAPIFEELGERSILIIEHRFPDPLKHLAKNGIYNVGLVAFRNDDEGRRCVDWWRERCLEWCYNRLEGDRFADQKYLDDWPTRFSGVVVLQNPGAGLAPWNVARYRLESNGQVTVDGFPLIFYHFTLFYRIVRGLYYLSIDDYGGQLSAPLKRIYAAYIPEVEAMARNVARVSPGRRYGFKDLFWLVRRGKSLSLKVGSRLWTLKRP